MSKQLSLGEVSVDVIFKDIKNVHLSVHPPSGRVTISAPERMSIDTIRAFASTKLPWIRKQQAKKTNQEREAPREFIGRESHFLWGKRYLLNISETRSRSHVEIDHKQITLFMNAKSSTDKRQAIMENWYRSQLKNAAWKYIAKWEKSLGISVDSLFVQRMKTKWGGASPSRHSIRLNTELAKKPKGCLDYIVLHEMIHFLVPNHGDQFIALMNQHMPHWQNIRQQLNQAPLAHLDWTY